jgi:hypothetical protein
MFGCVLVFRLVAATNMPARQANTQMDPTVASFETLSTTVGGSGVGQNLIEMLARGVHDLLHSEDRNGDISARIISESLI